MWADAIVVLSPEFDLCGRVVKGQELRNVQAFIAQSPIEALYVRVFGGLSRSDKVELDAVPIRTILQNSRSKLGTDIKRN